MTDTSEPEVAASAWMRPFRHLVAAGCVAFAMAALLPTQGLSPALVIVIGLMSWPVLAWWAASARLSQHPATCGVSGLVLLAVATTFYLGADTVAGDGQAGIFHLFSGPLLAIAVAVGVVVGAGLDAVRSRSWARRFEVPAKATAGLALCLVLFWTGANFSALRLATHVCEFGFDPPTVKTSTDVTLKGDSIVFSSERRPLTFGQRWRQRFEEGGDAPAGPDLYAVPTGGGDARRLTIDGCISDWTAAPDGSGVAVASGPEIWFVPLGGGNRQLLARGAHSYACPRFSTDSRYLAYAAPRGVEVIHAKSGDRVTSSTMAGCPAWLGAGSVAVVNADDDGPDVVEFDLQGGRRREWNFALDHVADIAASPDGSVLVVEESHVPIERRDATSFASKLHLASGDGSGLRPITPVGRSDTSPSWAPDASSFVIQSSVDVDAVFKTSEIWIVSGDGSSRRVISPARGRDRAPVWVRPR